MVEARCGTTAQSDLSYARRLETERHWQNSFFVHRIKQSSTSDLLWEAELYLENPHGSQKAPFIPQNRSSPFSFRLV